MTPLDDPRPFAAVMRDFLARHKLRQTPETAAIFGIGRAGLTKWLAGAYCPVERSHRALMLLIDEGRVALPHVSVATKPTTA